jgi:hypothetical protein
VHICTKKIRNHEDPRITLENRVLDVRKDHKILGFTLDDRLSWNKHIDETMAKTTKRLNILKSRARTKWEADQGTLLRVLERMILSALEYESVAYGSARELKRLVTIHNKVLLVALEAFCICRTEKNSV